MAFGAGCAIKGTRAGADEATWPLASGRPHVEAHRRVVTVIPTVAVAAGGSIPNSLT